MKTKYIIYGLLIIGLGSLVTYRIMANKSKTGQRGSQRGPGGPGGGAPVPVKGIVLSPKEFASSVSVTGSIQANEQIQLRPEVSGIIKGIYFKEGGIVRKGQTLIKISDTELQAQLSQALTRQKLASQTEFRAAELLKKEAISKEEYEVALADLNSLKAATQLIRAQISRTSVIAPFSGKIGLRTASVGEYVTPATVITTLVNIDPIKVIFSVPEKYASQIRQNSDIRFHVSGTGKSYNAKVYAINPGIDVVSRTLEIGAMTRNPSGELLPGSFANVDLPLSTIKDAILVPSEAVIPVEQGKMVFVSSNGKAREVKIETGTRTEKELLVLSGLKAGDTVLTTGIMALKPESPVKVTVIKSVER